MSWIDIAKQEGYLTQELARELKRAKIFGDIWVHDGKITFDKSEVVSIFEILRYALEHMYMHVLEFEML